MIDERAGTELNPSGAVQASIRVPPQDVLINPTGTSSSLWICLPKLYATAEKCLTESGEVGLHSACTSVEGNPEDTLGI